MWLFASGDVLFERLIYRKPFQIESVGSNTPARFSSQFSDLLEIWFFVNEFFETLYFTNIIETITYRLITLHTVAKPTQLQQGPQSFWQHFFVINLTINVWEKLFKCWTKRFARKCDEKCCEIFFICVQQYCWGGHRGSSGSCVNKPLLEVKAPPHHNLFLISGLLIFSKLSFNTPTC